jgi:hypothetical protein
MLVSAIAAAVSAIAAAVSAIFSWRSSRTAADAAATSLILKFRDRYASNEMMVDLRNLRAWYDRHASSKFEKALKEGLEQNNKDALIVDASRRRVTSFFSNIVDLHDTGLIPKRIEHLLTDFAGFDLLYGVVEPLERALSPDYDKARFDKLRKLRPAGDGLTRYTAIDWTIRDPRGCRRVRVLRQRSRRAGDTSKPDLANGTRIVLRRSAHAWCATADRLSRLRVWTRCAI